MDFAGVAPKVGEFWISEGSEWERLVPHQSIVFIVKFWRAGEGKDENSQRWLVVFAIK